MLRYILSLFTLLFLLSCSSIYYSAMEKIGIPKRELIVSRTEAARESQIEASVQFKSALVEYRSVVQVPSGELEEKYKVLKSELSRSESKAKAVRDRIAELEDVSHALFQEWEQELEQYQSERLRSLSNTELQNTQERYNQMMASMKRAENMLEPVLQPFRDNVLFLKHNLNAAAIRRLDVELNKISNNVDSLLRDMEGAISEADRFIAEMRSKKGDTLRD